MREYLRRILRKQAGDGSGLIYGMGHAVYTMSDPREVILKERAKHLPTRRALRKSTTCCAASSGWLPISLPRRRAAASRCAPMWTCSAA